MNNTKRPSFQFYPKDYESDENVKMMSLEQEGAFLRLMCHSWLHGSIPSEVAAQAKICRVPTSKMARLWPGIAPCFEERTPGRLVNPRQERDKATLEEHRKERAESGKEGGRAKWRPSGDVQRRYGQTRATRLAEAKSERSHTKEEWQALLAFVGAACLTCGNTPVVKDHIKPIYQGGHDGIENLQPLCSKCNAGKGPDTTDHRTKVQGFDVWLRQALARRDGGTQCLAASASAVSVLRSPSPTPNERTDERTRDRPYKPNPFVAGKKDEYELEALRLTAQISALTGEDGAEVFAKASHYEGALRQKVNPANMSEDRLLNTVIDLRATLKAAQEQAAKGRPS